MVLTSACITEININGEDDFTNCSFNELSGSIWEFDTFFDDNFEDPYRRLFTIEFISSNDFFINLDVNTCNGDYDLDNDCDMDFDLDSCTDACCDSSEAEQLIDDLRDVEFVGFDRNGNLLLFLNLDQFIVLIPF